MSDSIALAQRLLEALREAGATEHAAAFEAEFRQREWQIGAAERARVFAAIEEALATPSQHLGMPRPPDRFAILNAFTPWIATLPGDFGLVTAVHSLLEARSYETLIAATHRLFVDRLGYEAKLLEEVSRLGEQHTLSHVTRVAEHADFRVIVVQSRYGGPHSQCYDPVFKLHPRAIVLAFECGTKIRVLTRRALPSGGPRNCYRTLRGIGHCSFPDDDLLTWSWRLAQLQPDARDASIDLVRKAERMLSLSPTSVGESWDTAPIESQEIPGPCWEDSSAHEVELFLQPTSPPSGRLAVGLHLELLAAAKWQTREGDIEVSYEGYEIVAAPSAADDCVARRCDRAVELSLSLMVKRKGDPEGAGTPLVIPGVVTIPDDRGVYVLDGQPLWFRPNATKAALDEEEDEDDPEDVDEMTLLDADQKAGHAPEAQADVTPDEDPEITDNVYGGASQVALLRWVVGKRLRQIGYAIARSSTHLLSSPHLVRAFLVRRYGDVLGRVQLAAPYHLRRHLSAVVGEFRCIRLDDDRPLPAWACAEAAMVQEPGWATPIAGARIGPGGVITWPRFDGDGCRLTGAPADACTANPRFQASPPAFSLAPWIVTRWRSLADLPVGEPSRGFASECVARRSQAVARVRAPRTRFRIVADKQPLLRVMRRWCLDVPAETGKVPHIVVRAGDDLQPGDVMASLPAGGWWPRREHVDHNLQSLARFAAKLELEPEGEEIARCPPGLAGRVWSTRIEAVRDRLGVVLCHRLAVETWTDVEPIGVKLEDGRTIEIETCDPSSTPFRLESGECCDALLEDDAATIAREVADDDWIDGETGELIDRIELRHDAQYVYPAKLPALPDPALAVRVLDGLGIPRASGDPQLAQAVLRWWRATKPSAAAAIDAVAAASHGAPPASTSLYELALASHVASPPSLPLEWRDRLSQSVVSTEHDPIRGRRRHARSRDGVDAITRRHTQYRYAPWAWSCDCGVIIGPHRAFERCRGCGTRTEPRLRKGELPAIGVIPFEAPLLHPWRKPIVAALLGLTAQELEVVIGEHDGSALLDLTMSALVEPERSLLMRIERTTDPSQRERLVQGLDALRPVMHGALDLDDLWLSRLCLLPTRLLPDAYPLGSAELLASPLTSHYRLVASAAEQMSRAVDAGEPLLFPLTWIRSQRAVDDLFGSPTSPERGTLAEMWRRIWPSTAPAEITFAVPGLFRDCSPRMLKTWRGVRVFGRPPQDDEPIDDVIACGILGDGRITRLPEPALPNFPPSSLPLDEERRAWSWLTRQALTELAAICMGIDADPRVRAWVRPHLPNQLTESMDVGRFVLRALLEGLAPPHGQPSLLVSMLRAKKPLELAADRRTSTAALADRLTGALGVRHPGTDLAVDVLSNVMAGFWKGPRCEQAPTGWVWSPEGTDVPSGYRRMVPRLVDDAWGAWPGYLLLTDPVRSAALGSWNEALTPGHLAWLGLEVPPPTEPWWDQETHVQSRGVPEEVPEPAVEPLIPTPPSASPDPCPIPAVQVDNVQVRVLADPVPAWVARWLRGGLDD